MPAYDSARHGPAAALPAQPLDTLPGVQAFDVDLLPRQGLHSVQVRDDYPTALARLRYLAARSGPPEIAVLAWPDVLPQPPRRQRYRVACGSWISSTSTSW